MLDVVAVFFPKIGRLVLVPVRDGQLEVAQCCFEGRRPPAVSNKLHRIDAPMPVVVQLDVMGALCNRADLDAVERDAVVGRIPINETMHELQLANPR